jgi:hypothetical protein
VTVATVDTTNALTAKAVRFGCFSRVAQRVRSLLMSVMQEDRKLRSNCFALRRHRLPEEMILHLLGQVAPYPRNSRAQRARKLIRGHVGCWIGLWHLSYSVIALSLPVFPAVLKWDSTNPSLAWFVWRLMGVVTFLPLASCRTCPES